MIDDLLKNFSLSNPELSVPALVNVYKAMSRLPEGTWKTQKMKEVQQLAKDTKQNDRLENEEKQGQKAGDDMKQSGDDLDKKDNKKSGKDQDDAAKNLEFERAADIGNVAQELGRLVAPRDEDARAPVMRAIERGGAATDHILPVA